MAIHITGSDFISRSSNVVQGSSNYTCIFWYNFASVPSGTDYLSPFVTKKTDYSQFAAIFSLGDGTGKHEVQVTGGNTSAQLLAINTWYPVAYVRNGTSQKFYVSQVLVGSVVEDLSSNVFNDVTMGFDGFSVTGIKIYNFREWNTNLSDIEIGLEFNSPNSVVHTANLVTFTPLTLDLLDISGNGNNWTATGSPLFVADPFPIIPSAGTIFIPSDARDAVQGSAAIIDGTTGALIGIQPFPTASFGGRLPNGIFGLSIQPSQIDTRISSVNVYNTSLTLLGSVPVALWGSGSPLCASQIFFYLANRSSPFQLIRVTSSGTLDSSSWNLSGAAAALAVSPDDAIAYWLSTIRVIHRFDLINNIALSDLIAIPGVSDASDQLLVIGTDVLTLVNPTASTSWEVRRYSNTGTLLQTYGPILLAGNYDAPELFADPDGNFWVRAFVDPSDAFSTFFKFNITTGSVLTSFNVTDLDGGGQIPTTCPNVMIGSSLPGTGTIVVGKASNPLATGVIFTVAGPSGNFNIQTDASPGEIITVAPGTYSIVEQPSAGYLASYFVSNDPVNNNNLAIVVGSGELVDVVILNSLSTLFGGLYKLVPGKTHDTLLNQDRSTIDIMINWFWKLFIARDK